MFTCIRDIEHCAFAAEYPFERPSDAGDPQRFQKVQCPLPWPFAPWPALHSCTKTQHCVHAEIWCGDFQLASDLHVHF